MKPSRTTEDAQPAFSCIRMVRTPLTHINPREVEEISRRMDDPQDLNDAMLSVARDNAVADLMGKIERKMEADLMAAMGIPPTIEVSAEVSESRWSPNSPLGQTHEQS